MMVFLNGIVLVAHAQDVGLGGFWQPGRLKNDSVDKERYRRLMVDEELLTPEEFMGLAFLSRVGWFVDLSR